MMYTDDLPYPSTRAKTAPLLMYRRVLGLFSCLECAALLVHDHRASSDQHYVGLRKT